MRSTIHFVVFVLLSPCHGSILGTCDEVTRELHEGSPILVKDFQILVSVLILKKNGKQKHSHASNGSLIINNNNGTIISYWFLQFSEINLKHFKVRQTQDKTVGGYCLQKIRFFIRHKPE